MTGTPSRDDLEGRVAELERHVRALATAPRAAFTSITDDDGAEVVRLSKDGLEFFNPADGTRRAVFDGERLIFYAPTGEATVTVGEISFNDIDAVTRIEQGVIVQRTDGRDVLSIGADGRGMLTPALTYAPRRLNEVAGPVTSGAFTSVWQFLVPGIPSNSVQVRAVVSCDVGTTAEARLFIGGTAFATSAIACGSGALTTCEFKWDLQAAGVDLGWTFFLDVQIRRTGGAGNVYCHMPYPARTWDDLNYGADTDGIY